MEKVYTICFLPVLFSILVFFYSLLNIHKPEYKNVFIKPIQYKKQNINKVNKKKCLPKTLLSPKLYKKKYNNEIIPVHYQITILA